MVLSKHHSERRIVFPEAHISGHLSQKTVPEGKGATSSGKNLGILPVALDSDDPFEAS